MASLFIKNKPIKSITPDWYEKLLAAVAVALFVIVIVALAKGQAQWSQVPRGVWLHLATIVVALALTPYILLGLRGTKIHRLLGKVWVSAMVATAAISLFVRYSNPGHFSVIHILSVFVLIMAPRVWLTARKHNVAAHRGTVRGLVTGALIVAGYFTLLETRLLGHWLFG
ncbi:DUF2306 domain-containing protein [Sphingomonas bacterium]|uniref:DUF2306 domain-containing protein n=1 Tax=Sphingomonas bacterium TaxID=1895847 RepID=UPI002602BD9C|nr:DUF2306 domain-containing protein [Sphingomonas bacterium]MDB5678783.1 hypothetical protein [Sphingomonas bacterium]